MTIAEVTNEIEVAIHQQIVLDGRLPAAIAQQYGLTVEEVREIYQRASESAESRHGSNGAMWRFDLINAHLFDAAQLQGAWEKSTKPFVKKSKKTGGKFSPIVEKTVEERCGDPRFLTGKTAIYDAVAKLTGAEAPRELNINTKSQHDITFRLESMSDEELEKRATIARLVQEGVIQVDAKDVKLIEHSQNTVVQTNQSQGENNEPVTGTVAEPVGTSGTDSGG